LHPPFEALSLLPGYLQAISAQLTWALTVMEQQLAIGDALRYNINF
jgi:hypothetical protein